MITPIRRALTFPGMGAPPEPSEARSRGPARLPTLLVRSGWQTVNIGDIAHTPGVLHLLEEHVPEARVILWPNRLDRGVIPMLRRRFPRLRIVRGAMNSEPMPEEPELDHAFEEADFLLHGSGPSVVGAEGLREWASRTKKPYGIYGTTIGDIPKDGRLRSVLDSAAFVFTRETRSLELLRSEGIRCPDQGFTPDGTFAFDLRDDRAAARLLGESGLEPGRFLCVVPRLRYTPYWEFRSGDRTRPEVVRERKSVNEASAERDHAKLRAVIEAWVEATGQKVLLCPEMTYQVEILGRLLWEPLPASIKPRVVAMTRYWLPDEAASVYRLARGVVSAECHSPIIALSSGTPAFYVRQPTDSWKGQMYPDLGLGAWKFETDSVTGAELARRALGALFDEPGARVILNRAMAQAERLHAESMTRVRAALGLLGPAQAVSPQPLDEMGSS